MTIHQNELAIATPESQAVAQVPNVADMLQAVIKGGVSNENVAALEKLVGLYERMQDRDAEKAFATAFVALQSDLPTIVAKTIIPNRGKYEKYEDLMQVIQPLLTKHGFSVSYSQETKENRIIMNCHLMHIGGHVKSKPFAVRVGKADTETQADCKASTTAKRNALVESINLVIRQDIFNEDDDAAFEGNPDDKITSEQAASLEHRAKMVNARIPDLLAYAKAATFRDIQANKYDEIDKLLQRKEQQSKS